ncbi:MAG: hypothetical protein E7146_06010 [Rikenellaceae bacterium]|nr:hypothetical protein [Rikenellaceae bacterium]
MRNIFKSLMLVAVAAMTFTACQKDNGEVNALSKGTTLTVTANLADNDTRVAFGDLVDGVRKVTWEAGDMVSFIVYRNDAIYTFVNDLVVEADGATATFSVEFPKALRAGDRIEALVGHYVRESFGDIFTHEQQQQPTDEGLSTVYVKAVVDYDGNNDLSLTFNHMYPYGRMITDTDFATKFQEVKFVLDGVLENADSVQEIVTIYPQNITGNDYWFYCENEFVIMDRMSIEARGVDNRKYFKTIDNLLSADFVLLKGQIAAFKVGSFQTPLATPVAKATLTTMSSKPAIEITWDVVENAYQYIVTCEQTGEIQTINYENPKGCYALFNELKYDTEYSFTIFANPVSDSKAYIKSDVCYVSARTPKDVNAAADYNVTLTKVISISGNTINFAGENPQDRMRLEFNSGLTSIEAGTYAVVESFTSSTALEVSNKSQFNMAEAYNTTYDYYVNPGDLVNVAKSGDEYTITVITDTWINSVSASKSVKLTYTGKLEANAEDDGGLVFTTAVADPTQVGANWLPVEFSDGGSNILKITFGVAGNKYIQTGTWSTDYWYSSGYAMNNPWVLNGEDQKVQQYTAEVSVVDGEYNIAFRSQDMTINATFKGTIDNINLP